MIPRQIKKIAILGAGPAGLFMFKQLVEAGRKDISIDLFEASSKVGQGMPYSERGCAPEHVTNVSGNEIPAFPVNLKDWIRLQPDEELISFGIDRASFHEFEVVPRLLFGKYLQDQFEKLQHIATASGIGYKLYLNSPVIDVRLETDGKFCIEVTGSHRYHADTVVMCTGHYWPKVYEGMIPGYFDSPYPPLKLNRLYNHPVAISGGSLTAIDAVRTLAKVHGHFEGSGVSMRYVPNEKAANFRIILHAVDGLLPAVRFHLDDSHLNNDSLLTKEELQYHMQGNGGFLSLDFIFENDFKKPIREKDPVFYEEIKHLTMEEFVTKMMSYRESMDPFELMQKEYDEAALSIKIHKSVYWKEMLGVLSFAMNYPAKHFSAEDMLRLKKTLMPLIAVVIAYVPQSSCIELLALHRAGIVEMVAVEKTSKPEPAKEGGVNYEGKYYKTYINCIGQPHLSLMINGADQYN